MERNFQQNDASRGSNLVLPSWKSVIELRSRRGWSQEKLAEKSILSVRTIQNLEHGRSIHFGTLAKVAEALGVSADACIAGKKSIKRVSELPHCPYRGLLAFREEDTRQFFGRDSLIELLKQKLERKNLVQVSGCSGSGKSSLVAAGLIPALKQTSSWNILYCRPGVDPFASLSALLVPYLKPGEDEISRAAHLPRLREILEQGELSYLLAQILKRSGQDGLLLFVDQFEELFTHCSSTAVRERFLDVLSSLSGSASSLKLVFTIRADFTSRLLSHRRLTDETQDSEVKIGPMTRKELESVIRKPALQAGIRFERGLVSRILDDAGAEPSVLPVLQFALLELWDRQMNQTLTHSAYNRIGQLSGALAQRAEKIYRGLTPLEQETSRQIMTRLVRLGEDGSEDSRQRITLTSLFSEDLLSSDAGRRVLSVLADARLVTAGVEVHHEPEMVEIAHEALVRRWPRLSQWVEDDREILVWRQRLRLIIREWEQTGRDEAFLLRGPLLDEARLWLSKRANDLTPQEKDFISCSLSRWHRERLEKPSARLELFVDNAESIDSGEKINRQVDKIVGQDGCFRLQLDIIPVADGQGEALRSRLPRVPYDAVASLICCASPRADRNDSELLFPDSMKAVRKLDERTFNLVRDLQMRGSSGLALELLNPQLDGISDPELRLKFASIVFDMMHVRGKYGDAAELISQELALHPQNGDEHSPLLASLKIRLVHHQMFYRPVGPLWTQMVNLLGCVDPISDPRSYGEALFMLGGNLGTLRGDYREARKFLVKATRHAEQHRDQYLLARCLRKYGDFLRYHRHFHLAKVALMEALRLSARGRGTRQRIYVLGCLGDLERQQQNYSVASEYFERAIELARSAFIPGWLGNLHLGLAHIAIDKGLFDNARVFLGQAEAFYRSTRPRHWWGDIQVELARLHLTGPGSEMDWVDRARSVQQEAVAAGYPMEAAVAATLISGVSIRRRVLMFL